MIARKEFEQLMVMPEAVTGIHDIGVDGGGLVDYADVLFDSEEREVPFEEFFFLLLQLRGTNTATVKDIMDMRRFVLQLHRETRDCLDSQKKEIGRREDPSVLVRTCTAATLDSKSKSRRGVRTW